MEWKVLLVVSVLHSTLFVLLGTAQFASFCGYSRPRELRLFNADNRAIQNVEYRKKTASSYVICGRDCSMEKECKSFNFYKCQKLCQLNNSTWLDYPEAFVEDQDAVYFDGNEETPLFSLPNDGSCRELLEAGNHTSGIYSIYPAGFNDSLDVYCDMDTDGGGWIVIQLMQGGSVDFDRNWAEYQSGFGDLRGEHWLGNNNLQRLTSDISHGAWELRLDFPEGFSAGAVFAKYTDLTVTGENYTLDFAAYDVNSTSDDCLKHNKGKPFSTKDRDNDARLDFNCAEYYETAWWFNSCPSLDIDSCYLDQFSIFVSVKIRETCHN